MVDLMPNRAMSNDKHRTIGRTGPEHRGLVRNVALEFSVVVSGSYDFGVRPGCGVESQWVESSFSSLYSN